LNSARFCAGEEAGFCDKQLNQIQEAVCKKIPCSRGWC